MSTGRWLIIVAVTVIALGCGGDGDGGDDDGTGDIVVTCDQPVFVRVEPVPILLAASPTHVFVASSGSTAYPELIQVIELSAEPAVVSTIEVSSRVKDMAFADDRLFVIDSELEATLSVYDLSAPGSPQLLGDIALGTMANTLAVDGASVLVNTASTLIVVDATDPAALAVADEITIRGIDGFAGFINDVAVLGDSWYVSATDGWLRALDRDSREVLADFTPEPALTNTYAATGIAQLGQSIAYNAGNQLMVLDATDPLQLQEVARLPAGRGTWVRQLARLDDWIVVDYDLLDLAQPQAPTYAGRFQVSGFALWSIASNDDYLFFGYVNDQGEARGIVEITLPMCAQPP